jgi:hypothetical protein
VPSGLAAKLVIFESSTGYSANVVITNNATTTAWTWAVVVELAQSRMTNVWSASSSVTGSRLRLGPVAQNSVLAPGASTTVGFSATKTGTNYLPSVVSPIEPPRTCGTIAGLTCRAGEYCDLGVGTCNVADAGGICRVEPTVCPLTLVAAPVCGCDGKTYENACLAAAAGMNIDYTGECVLRTCGGIAGVVCRAGEYCAMDVGTCQIPDGAGTCQPMPNVCMDVVDLVCGCDGKTYNNACQAARAGTSVASTGACR